MIAYVDMFSGISGDMTLGALVDLGVPVAWLKEKLSAMPLKGFDIRSELVWRNGIRAVNLFVDQDPHVHARNWSAIRDFLTGAELPDRVRQLSLSAFESIARAESRIHGCDMDHVHFHEVGGIDALVDIVGSLLGFDYLGITQVYASRVPLGSGTVECCHGSLPVPVPATLALLKGVPVIHSGMEGELVTPTGAAIITTLSKEFGPMPDMVIGSVGYGSGKRSSKSSLPNLLRIITGDVPGETGALRREEVMVVETSIDDMNPEIFGYLMEKLLAAGALDVCHIPVQMKKNRPGTRLEILCFPGKLQDVINLVLSQSTSTGVRYRSEFRTSLDRVEVTVETRFGFLRAKQVTGPDRVLRVIPEYEVCRQVADERKIPIKDVYSQLYLDMNRSRL
ncbi:MAG: nickel pincer cofactor biosynthesis protein LarC [Pseudomonadota bacterium]